LGGRSRRPSRQREHSPLAWPRTRSHSLIDAKPSLLQGFWSVILIPVIIWSWITMKTTTALIFTAYMVPVNLVDNILRPILMSRGLRTPMLVIFVGAIGGTLSNGIIGLFVGPIVLAVAWDLLVTWVRDDDTVSA
jgi:predicted PurR-regulated permease PerM